MTGRSTQVFLKRREEMAGENLRDGLVEVALEQ